MRKLKSIVGLPAISISEGVDIGRVSEVVVDLSEGTILGVVVGTGTDEKAIIAEKITIIGPDAVMVPDNTVLSEIDELPRLAERRRPAGQGAVAVLTESGTKIGTIQDIFIDPEAMRVVRYEISAGPVRDLTDGTLSFPIIDGMVHGPDIVIVPDRAIEALEAQTGGLKGAWSNLSQMLKHERRTVKDRAAGFYEKSSEVFSEAVETAKQASHDVSRAINEKIGQARDTIVPTENAEEAELVTDDTCCTQTQSEAASSECEAEAPSQPSEAHCSECDATTQCMDEPEGPDAPAPES